MEHTASLQYLKGVGAVRAEKFRKLGLQTVGDLLEAYPRRYEDWTPSLLGDAPPEETVCVRVTPTAYCTEQIVSSGMKIYKTSVFDESGEMDVVFFNSGWQAKQLVPDVRLLLRGVVGRGVAGRQMRSPQIRGENETGLHAVYPLTAGLSARVMEEAIATALTLALPDARETLPQKILSQYDLLPLRDAVRAVHQPKSFAEAAQARRRLIFDELYQFSLQMQARRKARRNYNAPVLRSQLAAAFLERLPFRPTGAQQRCTDEIARDMASSTPMRRLLQGDVGSGKTAVAAAALSVCAQSGYQAALLAPTEILARQHHKTLTLLLAGDGLVPVLLVSALSAAEKRKVKEKLTAGEIRIVVGTHAILEKDVRFRELGLLVADEQHRFGVRQIEAGAGASAAPHLLLMSATPIPRSLAHSIYGDLDVSFLDERPPGRIPVKTFALGGAYKERVYAYARKFMENGRQVYIVCPRVESPEEEPETQAPSLAGAKALLKELSETEFKGYRLGLLHGKQSAKEKQAAMEGFAAGEIRLLVATTIVEVGVDVPSASLMIVCNAERFGLSQLHQLRGRVGRAPADSAQDPCPPTCVLLSDNASETSIKRLGILAGSNDGFAIAQADLELRGPGEFFGQRQHGLPPFKLADLLRDTVLLAQARQAALRADES
jgi:ATP-dependent DNA helicase RecG